MSRRTIAVNQDKLEFAPGSAFASSPDRIKTSDCGEIEDIAEFVRYAAGILAQLDIVHSMRPELLLTFATLLKTKGKDEAICALAKRLYKKNWDRKQKKEKNFKKSRKAKKQVKALCARRNASTTFTSTKS